MPIGPALRERLGRFEQPATDLYRGFFISLDDLAVTLASVSDATSILEIGCGAGHLSNRLLERFPEASLVGADICEAPGDKCTGFPGRTEFVRALSTELVAERAGQFDLVVICDVVHHVPAEQREELLRSALDLCKPGGLVAVKDWERENRPAHAITYFADRYISGDKGVAFMTYDEQRDLVLGALPEAELVLEARVPPRRNNVLLVLRKPA